MSHVAGWDGRKTPEGEEPDEPFPMNKKPYECVWSNYPRENMKDDKYEPAPDELRDWYINENPPSLYSEENQDTGDKETDAERNA